MHEQAIQELQGKTTAVVATLTAHTAEQKRSYQAHKMTLSVLGMLRQLRSTGRATESVCPTPCHHQHHHDADLLVTLLQIQALRVAAEKDPVIEAVIESLPPSVYTRGVPTLRTLQHRYTSLGATPCVALSKPPRTKHAARLTCKRVPCWFGTGPGNITGLRRLTWRAGVRPTCPATVACLATLLASSPMHWCVED